MPRFFRFFAFLVALFLILSVLPVWGATEQERVKLPSPITPAPAVLAEAFALFDPISGCFLAQGNAERRLPMASTTKIMTALVVLERVAPEQTVIVPKEAVGIEGSSVYLFENEEITVKTLLYALLLNSANDAATALAIHTAGSIAAFAALMNEKAAALGLVNTHFTNPHGLFDEAHYTTAKDLALITAAALENKTFAEIASTVRYSVPQNGTDATRLFLNHNRLLRTFEGAIGVKTGFTKKSGRCLVSAAKREGLTLIAVTLNDPNDWRDHKALLDWGFSEYKGFSPMPEVLKLPVVGGEAGEVTLLPRGGFSLTLPKAHGEITCTVEAPRFLFAGFEAGKEVGRLVYRMDGKLLGTLPLVTEMGVKKANVKRTIFSRIQDIFTK